MAEVWRRTRADACRRLRH